MALRVRSELNAARSCTEKAPLSLLIELRLYVFSKASKDPTPRSQRLLAFGQDFSQTKLRQHGFAPILARFHHLTTAPAFLGMEFALADAVEVG